MTDSFSAFSIPTPIDGQDWHELLTVTTKKDVETVDNTVTNICIILENDGFLRGRLRYNAFTDNIERGEMPWGDAGNWCDRDTAEIRRYLETYRKSGFQRDKILEALLLVACRHEYHPVRDYLASLVWD
ncbi:MAG: hypothetical protein HUJ90_06000, partial [Bacteroidales bacterium]|nr:hypothetical protein [Bacteroidales bacterium]